MDKNALFQVQELLKNLQTLLTSNDGINEKLNNTSIIDSQPKNDALDMLLRKREGINAKDVQQNLGNDQKNAEENIKKPKEYKKLEKCEKDIYNIINSKGERVGSFYGVKPIEVAKKCANRIYKENNKELFEVKIYNMMTNRIYTYKAQIVQCEKIKRIKNKKIAITHTIKLTRI